MSELLLAVVWTALLVVVALALLSAVTLAPFVVGLQMAEARRFSTARWGALTLAGVGVAMMLALVLLRGGAVATPASATPAVGASTTTTTAAKCLFMEESVCRVDRNGADAGRPVGRDRRRRAA